MTSNVGAASLVESRKSLGFLDTASDDSSSKVMASLKDTFRPEFLNRVDDIIVFNKLDDTSIKRITEIMLEKLAQRVRTLGVELEFSPEVTELLAREGYDPVYGARPLRRVIAKRIEDTLAAAFLDGSVSAGMSVRANVCADGKIVYKVK